LQGLHHQSRALHSTVAVTRDLRFLSPGMTRNRDVVGVLEEAGRPWYLDGFSKMIWERRDDNMTERKGLAEKVVQTTSGVMDGRMSWSLPGCDVG
jgi:hypothetical protein